MASTRIMNEAKLNTMVELYSTMTKTELAVKLGVSEQCIFTNRRMLLNLRPELKDKLSSRRSPADIFASVGRNISPNSAFKRNYDKPILKKFISRVILALNWRMDVAGGEIVEHLPHYSKSHLAYVDSVSLEDLNSICDVVNNTFSKYGSSLRISSRKWEIIPTHRDGL